ncbi:unnamed protein product [Rotaria sp. Silwood2]|nr:unnamed protein product [Rotaria sp. Silwood2]
MFFSNRGNNENYFKLITAIVETLFTTCTKNGYDVRLTFEENLNKLVKNLKEPNLTRIQVELHRIIKRNPNVGSRALKANVIHPKKIRPFSELLSAVFCSIAACSEDIVHEKLSEYYELIFRILDRLINDKEYVKMNDELDSTSVINNEKRTSAAKLVERLVSNHTLERLNLSSNKIKFIPRQILHSLPQLQIFNITSNLIRAIPNSLSRSETHLHIFH